MSRCKIADQSKDKKLVSIFKRGNKLYLQFIVDEKKYQRSTGLDDSLANRKIIKNSVIPKLEHKIISGEFSKDKNRAKKFNFYADKYLLLKENLKSYKEWHNIVVNQLLPVFANSSIDAIKRSDIKDFIDKKLEKVSPKRARTLLNVIVAIINIAIDYEDITSNVALNIQLPKHKKEEFEPFSVQEVNKVIDTADGWLKNYCAFAFYTGARIGELLALRWSDIDLDNGYIDIQRRIKKGEIDTPKTKSSIRKVPILEPLIPFIKAQFSISQENMSLDVFQNPHSGKMFYDSKKLVPFWKELLIKCNIEYKIPYTTRHTFITNMLNGGKLSILDIAQIVGHTNSEMIVKNYAKYIKGEHLKISRNYNPFADNSTDTALLESY